MSETDKMLTGRIYDSSDHALSVRRAEAHKLCKKYNDTFEDETEKRTAILDRLLPNRGKDAFLQGPVYFDYGVFTSIGINFYANFNLTILDCCAVTIGNDVFIGPNVSILTPVHPLRYQDRNVKVREDGTLFNYEYARPITIGDNCWIAGNVTILGGVHIGIGCVIGAGSVVTRDIPNHSLAAGTPCKILREITENDSIELKKELF